MDFDTSNVALRNKNKDESIYNINNEHLLINQVYTDDAFKNFNRFCIVKNLYSMGDLKDFDFNQLEKIKGFKQVQIEKIISKYRHIMFNEIRTSAAKQIRITGKSKIEDVFHEEKFTIFRNFCFDNGYKYIDELKLIDFQELLSIEGFGGSKITQIKKRLEFLNIEEDLIDEINFAGNKISIACNYNIHADYNGIDISALFDTPICEILRKMNINTIPDLSTVSLNIFNKNTARKSKQIICERLKLLELPLTEFVTKSFMKIRDEKEYVYYRAVVYYKKTLEELSKQYGVSRQRISQMKKCVDDLVQPIIVLFESVIIKNGLLNNKITFDFETLVDLIGSYDNAIIARDVFENNSLNHIRYSKVLEQFLINKRPASVEDKIEIISEELGNLFSFDDEIIRIEDLLIENQIEFIDVFDFPNILIKLGYKKYNEYFIKGSIVKEKLFECIVKKYYRNGIEHNDDNILSLKRIALKDFGLDFYDENNERNLWAILERSNTLILWGKSKRMHIDNVFISDELIKIIKNEIAREINETSVISAAYIYEQYKLSLLNDKSNIHSKEALYGVLKYYCSDAFEFKKLTIKKKENEINLQVLLEEYLTTHDGYADMKAVRLHFSKWTDSMLNDAINSNNNILSWDNGNTLILKYTLQLQDDFKQRFQEKIDVSFIDGYTNGYMISKSARVLLLKNRVKDDGTSVYSLAKSLFSDTYFFTRRPHILKSKLNRQFTSIDLILTLFEKKCIISYGEIKKKLINDYQINEVLIGNQITKALLNLFQVDIDEYCLPNNVTYQMNVVDECISYVDELITKNGYAILSQMEQSDLYKYTINICDVSLSVNSYIIKSIITQEKPEKYRLIIKKGRDWRYDNIIIVYENSSISNFVDAIIYILDKEFVDKENFTLSNIEIFLRNKELIVNKIPDEFINSDRVLIDDFGRVSIRE